MESGDYLELHNEGEETGRIFTLLFNSSNLISPAYAAAIVLGISFGIAALLGLLYYALVGGFDSAGGSGYGSYTEYFQRLGFRRRRSLFEDELDLLSILESLDSSEKTINHLNKENRIGITTSGVTLCKVKFKICQLAQNDRSSYFSRSSESYHDDSETLRRFFVNARKLRDKMKYDLHFENIKTKDKRKLEVLEDILKESKYLKYSTTRCDEFLQGCNTTNA